MLQGYRMCDRLCHICDTILLMDRSGKDYCVSCKELNPPPPQKKEPVPIITPKTQRPVAPTQPSSTTEERTCPNHNTKD